MPPFARHLLLLVALLLPSAAGLVATNARAAGDPVIAAAGDIACAVQQKTTPGQCRQAETAKLIESLKPAAVLALGDEQYPCGSAADFATSFEKTWGKLKAKLHPVPGNHEYNVGAPGKSATSRVGSDCATTPSPSDAAGYYGYFGAAATPLEPSCRAGCGGWYSFDIGAWHIIGLNSNCEAVSCTAGSAQETWLKADLAAHPNACTLAMWHHPRFSSGISGNNSGMATLWRDLYQTGADVVLTGHDHDYERFAPLDGEGYADSHYGVVEFVVGTGGADHYAFRKTPAMGSAVRIQDQFGVLTLTLQPKGYDWAFHALDGKTLDSGHAGCHGAPSGS